MAHYDTHTKPKDCLSGHIILLRLTAERYCTLLPLLSASIVLFGDLFFIVLLTIWHYWMHQSGFFVAFLGGYVKPVWSSYPHCSFGHDCSAYRFKTEYRSVAVSMEGALWAYWAAPFGWFMSKTKSRTQLHLLCRLHFFTQKPVDYSPQTGVYWLFWSVIWREER